MEEKKFFWIRLKDSFLTSDKVDYLMSKKDGANYIIIYQMLCLKTINTDGELARQIGDILIPYDVEKITRDLKYFSVDTVRIALESFKALGMVYVQDNGILRIADFNELVGSSVTDEHTRKLGAERQQRFRDRQKQLSVTVTDSVTLFRNGEIEKEKEKDKDNIKEKNIKKKSDVRFEDTSVFFADPSLDEMFKEFLEYRRKVKKKPLKTERGILSVASELKKLAQIPFSDEINVELAKAIIQQTLDNEWLGFFELKNKKNPVPKNYTKEEQFNQEWGSVLEKARCSDD